MEEFHEEADTDPNLTLEVIKELHSRYKKSAASGEILGAIVLNGEIKFTCSASAEKITSARKTIAHRLNALDEEVQDDSQLPSFYEFSNCDDITVAYNRLPMAKRAG